VLVAGDNGGVVHALDADTGKVLWSKDFGQPINGSAAIDTQAPGGPAWSPSHSAAAPPSGTRC
jgi:outer membrane protein assembly factor BamB